VRLTALAGAPLASGRGAGIGSYVPGIVVAGVLIMVVIAGVGSIFSATWRPAGLRITGFALAGIVLLYAVGRGIAEFWVVNYSDAASYEHSWGGPSLAGVFAVHSGSGFVLAIAAVWLLLRRRGRRKTAGRDESGCR
jgi:hypothetical protein